MDLAALEKAVLLHGGALEAHREAISRHAQTLAEHERSMAAFERDLSESQQQAELLTAHERIKQHHHRVITAIARLKATFEAV